MQSSPTSIAVNLTIFCLGSCLVGPILWPWHAQLIHPDEEGGAAANWNLFRWRRNEWMNDSRQANENKQQNQIFCCYGWEWETDVNQGPCTIDMKWKNLEFRHDMMIKRITRYIVGYTI